MELTFANIISRLDILGILNGTKPNSRQAVHDLEHWVTQNRAKFQNNGKEIALISRVVKHILNVFRNFIFSKLEATKVNISIYSLRVLMLDIRHAIDRMEDITEYIDMLLKNCNGPILKTYRMLCHMCSSVIGHSLYEYLEYTIGIEFSRMIRTISMPSSSFLMVCRSLANIDWDTEYHIFLRPTWISNFDERDSQLILKILRNTSETISFDDVELKTTGCDLEVRSKLIIELLNKVTSVLYPDECFEICRKAAKSTFGNITFHKQMMIQKILNGGTVADNIHDSSLLETIYFIPDFKKEAIDKANIEISEKVLKILLSSSSKFEETFFNLLVFMDLSKKSTIYKNFRFIPQNEMRVRFLRKIVRHVIKFSSLLSPPEWSKSYSSDNFALKIAEEKSSWSKYVGFFLRQSDLSQNFIECFFEEWILKGLIGGQIKLNIIKNICSLNSINELGPELFYFKKIVEHTDSSLHIYMSQFNSNFTTELCDKEIHLLILPSRSFRLRSSIFNNVPFHLSERWKNRLLSVADYPNNLKNTDSVQLEDQPHLHRVILKSFVFGKRELQLNLNLYHAIILDTFFNKKDSWSIEEMQETLDIIDLQKFQEYLSSLVKYGLLRLFSDSIYKLNSSFKPNPKLEKNNVIYFP